MVSIGEAGLGKKCIRTQIARNQRPDDQQRGRASSSNNIIVEVLNFAAGVVADPDVNQDADENRNRVYIHPGDLFFVASRVGRQPT